MPTKRTRRTRTIRRAANGAIKRYIHGRITKDQLCEAYDFNPFVIFAIELRQTNLGAQAFEIWEQDGQRLLNKAGYTGPKRVKGLNMIHHELPEHLSRMVSAFGQPWKA